MFGLITSSELEATQSSNMRRQVFYQRPNGTFPLMGLMSMMDEKEEVDKTTFGWEEERQSYTRSTTAMANAAGPFTATDGASGAVGTDLTAAGWTKATEATARIKVADASVFRPRDVVWAKDVPGTSSSIKQVKGIVTAVWTAHNTIDITFVEGTTNALNTTAANGLHIFLIGSAAVEGGYSKVGGMTLPLEVFNHTQIFRTVVGPFSRNALKMGQEWDKTGPYQKAAKDGHVRHMEAMEQALYWGVKGSQLVTDEDDGLVKRRKTFGGLLYWLQQWELGNTGNGGSYDFRPGGTNIINGTWDSSDDKRILDFAGASISQGQWNDLVARMFTSNTDAGWEKIVICGNGLLSSINEIASLNTTKMIKMDEDSDEYGMGIHSWKTVFGDLHFKTHPLFTKNPALTNSGFVVDVGTLGYHAFQDSDTELLIHRQARDFDGRKDEWLTEFGLEVNFPENNLYINNLGGITL